MTFISGDLPGDEMWCELDVNIGLYLRAAAGYLWVQMQYVWFGSATYPKVQSTISLDFQKEKLETIDASHQEWLSSLWLFCKLQPVSLIIKSKIHIVKCYLLLKHVLEDSKWVTHLSKVLEKQEEAFRIQNVLGNSSQPKLEGLLHNILPCHVNITAWFL